MAEEFNFAPDSSLRHVTPDRSRRTTKNAFDFPAAAAHHASTTPAGPPPSTAGSFTPAGTPSDSLLGSSIMHGLKSSDGSSEALEGLFAGVGSAPLSSKKLFGPKGSVSKRSTPLGRSIVRGTKGPSRLSQQISVAEDEQQEPEQEQEQRGKARGRQARATGTFGINYDDDDDASDGEVDEVLQQREEEEVLSRQSGLDMEEDHEGENKGDGDMWLDMADDEGVLAERDGFENDSDLLMLVTPAATERVIREAESFYRASTRQSHGGNIPFQARHQDQRFSGMARGVGRQMRTAEINEPGGLILSTENLVTQLYDDGVGTDDDPHRLEGVLANVADALITKWAKHADGLPKADVEHVAELGPGPDADPFEKAEFLANLALRLHHTRHKDETRVLPLPETLLRWQAERHAMYSGQVAEVLRHRPSPACHALYWQTVFMSVLRGNVGDAASLLHEAGWEQVRRTNDYAYSGRALENVQVAVGETVKVLESCPGHDGNWEIWGSDWTLFRVRAQGVLDQLRRFAEGGDADLDRPGRETHGGRESLAGLSRMAKSQVPWEVYENINVVFEMLLGSAAAILDAAQDWCEATIGLFAWWDEQRGEKQLMSRTQALTAMPPHLGDQDSYLDRLSQTFHAVMDSDFKVNPRSQVEVAMACVFEDNATGLIGILRAWSLPVASAVAEIASLGRWLPVHRNDLSVAGLFGMDKLDLDDLAVLGIGLTALDDMDGAKDSTLAAYARALAELGRLSDKRDGWELAVHVLGRMESPERSEAMVKEIVEKLLEGLEVGAGPVVLKIWKLMNELGMIPFAEGAAEKYGDLLASKSHGYGEAMWYYSLAHCPTKIREVMNLLISHSLLNSAAYPPTAELDDHLSMLLNQRSKTLQDLAKQDLEAADLLGKMLSGYASLRRFYQLRDRNDGASLATRAARRREAAAALVSVVASADDNIRGGLYDASRDGIVSEDFLLALLGEALVFVSGGLDNASPKNGEQAIRLQHIEVLLKAVEDLQAVNARVYSTCDEFLSLVLWNTPGGLKGGTPADLLAPSEGGNFALSGRASVLAGKFAKSMSGAASAGVGAKRGWDWREGVGAGTKGEDVIRRVRMGVARDLAGLWLGEVDGKVW